VGPLLTPVRVGPLLTPVRSVPSGDEDQLAAACPVILSSRSDAHAAWGVHAQLVVGCSCGSEDAPTWHLHRKAEVQSLVPPDRSGTRRTRFARPTTRAPRGTRRPKSEGNSHRDRFDPSPRLLLPRMRRPRDHRSLLVTTNETRPSNRRPGQCSLCGNAALSADADQTVAADDERELRHPSAARLPCAGSSSERFRPTLLRVVPASMRGRQRGDRSGCTRPAGTASLGRC
jgi:hypothetical protein